MYIKEGYNGHSLELMSPSGSEVDSKKPTHPRVDWKAPPPATEIGAPFASDDVGHIGLIGLPGSTVRVFRQKFTVEDAIGSTPLLRLKRAGVRPMIFLSGVHFSYQFTL